jgi:hypothetical protein
VLQFCRGAGGGGEVTIVFGLPGNGPRGWWEDAFALYAFRLMAVVDVRVFRLISPVG